MINKMMIISLMACIFMTKSYADSPFSYNQLGFVIHNISVQPSSTTKELKFDGPGIFGSFEFSDDIFVFISTADLISDEFFLSDQNIIFGQDYVAVQTITSALDYDSTQFGLGIHTPISATSDFITGFSHIKSELELDGVSIQTNSGLQLDLMIRHQLKPSLELSAALAYANIKAKIQGANARTVKDNTTTIGAAIDWFMTNNLVLGLALSSGSESNGRTIKLAYYF